MEHFYLNNEQSITEATMIEREYHGRLVVYPVMNIVQVKLEDMSLVNIDENAHIEVILYGNSGSFKERVTRDMVLETFKNYKYWSLYEGLECFVRL